MPEYLAPGVYVEEVSFRARSIEGVSTTTTGFIGPTRYGPLTEEPDILTSLGEFERVYGDGQPLLFTDADGNPVRMDNYLWHAARAFFEEGGKRLYVVRAFRPQSDDTGAVTDDGIANWPPPAGADPADLVQLQARHPGAAGNRRARLAVRIGQDVLAADPDDPARLTVSGLQDREVVWIGRQNPAASPLDGAEPAFTGAFYAADSRFDPATQAHTWTFRSRDGDELDLGALSPPDFDPDVDEIRPVSLVLTVFPSDPNDLTQVWNDLGLDPLYRRFGAPAALTALFGDDPPNRAQAQGLPLRITPGGNVTTGLDLLAALDTASGGVLGAATWQGAGGLERSFDFAIEGGNDGMRPGIAEYEGTDREDQPFKTGLKAFEDLEDISIVAAPGSTYGFENGYNADARAIVGALIRHAQRMRYRIAVLDSGDGQTIAQVRAMRAKLDSKYAALYYPWVRVLDPITRSEIHLPPSGFVAGIYARNDIERAVFKAPANEVVGLALGFEQLLNKSQQDVLNPEGINCFRYFEGRGFRLWGARTISSDPEWKYVNLRRYFAYVERSIDRGTQWVVFEPNGEALWANVRRTVEDFLLNEWQMGALLGDKPEKAYFVRCDRSTMTQNDLDNGRLVCLVGLAPLRPAEFVIFRIGQWTADRRA